MKNPLLYKIIRPLMSGAFKLFYRPTFINKKVIPKTGRLVLAGTHVSKMDPLIIASSTKRCVRGVAKAELFKGIGKVFFNGIGAIPVNRQIKDQSVIPACVRILEQDGLVGIAPEGTINRTDEIIMPFKLGALKMAIESKSPIVPFAIIGEYKLFKKGIKIAFGELYYPKTTDAAQETKILENKVIKLIKKYQEYE